jgi:hypothetical protein
MRAVIAVALVALAVPCRGQVVDEETLDRLRDMEISFTNPLPKDVPDPSSWRKVDDQQVGIVLEDVHTSKERGNPVAVITVKEGVCPDAEAFCYLGLRWQLFSLHDEASHVTRMLMRYVLISDQDKRLEGLASGLEFDQADRSLYEFWLLDGGAWCQREGDAELTPDDEFTDWIATVAKRIMRNRERQDREKSVPTGKRPLIGAFLCGMIEYYAI